MSEGKKIKFTWVDLVIIVVVLAVGAFAVKKLMGSKPKTETVTVKMTVAADKLTEDEVPEFKVGDDVFVGDVTTETGAKITGIKEKANEATELNKNTGEYVKSKSDIYKTVEVEVEATAKEDDVNIECGDTTLKVGMQVELKGANGYLKGTIMSIDETKKGAN